MWRHCYGHICVGEAMCKWPACWEAPRRLLHLKRRGCRRRLHFPQDEQTHPDNGGVMLKGWNLQTWQTTTWNWLWRIGSCSVLRNLYCGYYQIPRLSNNAYFYILFLHEIVAVPWSFLAVITIKTKKTAYTHWGFYLNCNLFASMFTRDNSTSSQSYESTAW